MRMSTRSARTACGFTLLEVVLTGAIAAVLLSAALAVLGVGRKDCLFLDWSDASPLAHDDPAYARTLELAPDFPAAWYGLAEVWRDQGRGMKAADAVRRCIGTAVRNG